MAEPPGRSILEAWRKARTQYISEEVSKSQQDCQKMAIHLAQKALTHPFKKEQVMSGPWINAYVNGGACKWEDFVPIMQAQCQTTFGEKCSVNEDLGDWPDEKRWGINFHASK